ncbi:MAG: FAD-binding oxidoreductase [Phycisphaerales bacterium]|nr:FAD-binding oxidoreductase [Phycisphaerales bacterium]
MSASRVDVVIIGGGVAGLWCRWRLASAGYSVALIERSRLGDGQTAASQGILHRGVKYALSAEASRAAATAEASARVWDDAMSGKEGPDLSGVEVVAASMLMWTDAGVISKLTGAIASKVLTSRVVAAERRDIPAFLEIRGRSVYRVDETVINPVSVLRCLADAAAGPIVCEEVRAITPGGASTRVTTGGGEFEAGAVVLCAGAGNELLLELLGKDPAAWTQHRDLHMVVASGAPGKIFGHWVASATDKPRLTITSADVGGLTHWYVGGDLAEQGVARTPEDQIEAAKSELRSCFHSLSLAGWNFRTIRISRAEGKDASGKRPDGPVVRRIDGTGGGTGGGTGAIAVWPTKLVMAPAAADEVLKLVRERIAPTGAIEPEVGRVRRPDYALAPWQSPA